MVDVGLPPELLELLLRQLLPERRGHHPQLLHLNEAVLVLVKNLECLFQVLEETEKKRVTFGEEFVLCFLVNMSFQSCFLLT